MTATDHAPAPVAPPFTPDRATALARLAAFVPHAGRSYAAGRNHDLPGNPAVSRLSPWLRHRVLTEEEVAAAVLAAHSPSAANRFLQELMWRTYWKGWLERHPAVWNDYRRGVAAGLQRLQAEGGLRRQWEAACTGATGIEGFDHWAQEIVETGYLHNHARMSFASIWIFTLRLPWELGADFFLRHLLDGDPASNTLSWRWVGGLQTIGKTYLARPETIAECSGGRFRPAGLATEAPPLPARPHPPTRPAPAIERWDRGLPTGLLLTDDDLSPGFLVGGGWQPAATALMPSTEGRSPLEVAAPVLHFAAGCMADAAARWRDRLGPVTGPLAGPDAPACIAEWAAARGLRQVVTPHAPVGPAAARLAEVERLLAARGIRLVCALRDWDAAAWLHATHGFFRFREAMPRLLAHLLPGDAA